MESAIRNAEHWAASQRYCRRAFLSRTAAGLIGSLALRQLLADELSSTARGGIAPRGTAASRPPRTADRVICLFQNGGPSQVDLFDPKPVLSRFSGQPFPGGKSVETLFVAARGNLLGSPFAFRRSGESGIELSELLPHTASVADDITLIRSMVSESVCHEAALRLAHSGSVIASGRPSLGSWVLYGLGSMNRDLPAFVVLPDPGGLPINGVLNWSSGWLPAIYQGTPFAAGSSPVLNLDLPAGLPSAARAHQLRLLDSLNREHLAEYPENTDLGARIANFETAARMQSHVPRVVDLSGETEWTRRLYGLDQPATRSYGTRLLLARRLVEHGVRFVGVYLNGQPWDTHSENAKKTREVAAMVDRPCAALIRDLKARGLLDSTIVLWMGEFGRTPVSQGPDGRDHSRRGFSLWLAGGPFRRGHVHGATDDFGYEATSDVVTLHDLHATLLAALGLDHVRLSYPHDGRRDSLTDADVTGARVVSDLWA